MKYIIQIKLDKRAAANRGLFGLYDWHKEVWKLFPGRPRDKRDFLTRLDINEYEFRFTIVSDSKPQKPDGYSSEWYKEREIPSSFFERKQYLFQLTANPTITLSRRDPSGKRKKNGSHYAITKHSELKNWFYKKATQGGFLVLDAPVLEITKPVFYKFRKKNGYNGVIVGVEFKGALKVTNQEKFLKTISEGIGRARGLGFGLLVIKPI